MQKNAQNALNFFYIRVYGRFNIELYGRHIYVLICEILKKKCKNTLKTPISLKNTSFYKIQMCGKMQTMSLKRKIH